MKRETRVLEPVEFLQDEEADLVQGFALVLLFPGGARILGFDDGAHHLAIPADRAGGEFYGVKMPILVHEDLIALLLQIRGSGAIDRALFERIRGAIGFRVMDEVMQGRPLDLGERISRQLFRCPVHVHAVLAVVHDEQGDRRVVTEVFEVH